VILAIGASDYNSDVDVDISDSFIDSRVYGYLAVTFFQAIILGWVYLFLIEKFAKFIFWISVACVYVLLAYVAYAIVSVTNNT